MHGDLADPQHLFALEEALILRAGDNYRDLGANAVVPVSRALWRMSAKLNDMELYAFFRYCMPELASDEPVACLMNIFNGGLHALLEERNECLGRDRIDFQEMMIVPVASTYRQVLEMGDQIDAALKIILIESFGENMVSRADEAGFSVKGLGDNFLAFDLLIQAYSSEKMHTIPYR